MYFVCKQFVHCLMNCWVSRRMPSQKKLCWRRQRVLASPIWPPSGDLWYSSRRRGMKGFPRLIHMCPWYSKSLSLILNSGHCRGLSWTRFMRVLNSSNTANSFLRSSRNLRWGVETIKKAYVVCPSSCRRESASATTLLCLALYWIV